MQSSPLGSVVVLGQNLLGLSFHLPNLEPFPTSAQLGFTHFPYDGAPPVATDPLAVHINVEVNVKAALDVYSHIGRWYCLAEGGCRCDRREKRQSELERLCRLGIRRWGGDEVGQIRRGSIVLRTEIRWEGNIVAINSMSV